MMARAASQDAVVIHNRVRSRYMGSVFMGHGRAVDILEHFMICVADLRLARVLQVSMDGPNVNWAFYDLLQNQMAEEYNCQLLNLGSCGLHSC